MGDCCLSAVVGVSIAVISCSLSELRHRYQHRQQRNSITSKSELLHEHSILSTGRTSIRGRERSAISGDGSDFSQDDSEVRRTVSAEQSAARRKVYGLGGFCSHNRILLCMVGLPARGKSYIVNMLTRYLRWTGFSVQAFNAGNVRRFAGLAGIDAKFFSGDKDASSKREQLAFLCLEEALSWLVEQDDGAVAIFDATNSTIKRRSMVADRCREVEGITPLFVESICDDPAVLEKNYAMKLGNDDYRGMDPVAARADFLERVKMYEKRYETLDESENDGLVRFIKLINIGKKVVLNNCFGYAPSHIGFYLSNIHITPRCIWLCRHAQTKDTQNDILGSVSDVLTRRGVDYCKKLAVHVQTGLNEFDGEGRDVIVLTGTAPVHRATNDALCGTRFQNVGSTTAEQRQAMKAARNYPLMSTSLLNELDGGDCNGMSYDMIQKDYPAVWAARETDKLNFRYPGAGGESYADVVNRLKPVIIELERRRGSIIVFSHLAVQRCIFAYFTGCPMEELPHIEMDMHTVFELHPGPFGTRVETVAL